MKKSIENKIVNVLEEISKNDCFCSDGYRCLSCRVKEIKKEMNKPKRYRYICFELTMPGVGSWNGRWSGEGQLYARVKRFSGKDELNFKDGDVFSYCWDDGWCTNVRVSEVDYQEKKKIKKASKGFCGYDWMIDSIIKYGKILSSIDLSKDE